MKKLLITGAYGLVGSTIRQLLKRDYPDIEVHTVKHNEVMVMQHNDFNKLTKFDYIIHASGYGQPIKFNEDRLSTIRINTSALYDEFAMLQAEGRFIFVSSSEVYSGAKPPHKETDIGTTTPQHPRSCYIESKRCGEAICMAYKEIGYDVKIARLALAYGPGTKKGDTRVLNQLIEQALTKKEIRLIDNGGARRTYIYVEDAAKWILKILFEGRDIVYNVGGISRTTIYELAQEIGNITGAKVIKGKNKLVGAPENVELDITKIRTELPQSFTYLLEGLKKTIEYQKTLYV